MHLSEVLAYVAHASQLHGQHVWPAFTATVIFLGPELFEGTADCLCVSLSGLLFCGSPKYTL